MSRNAEIKSIDFYLKDRIVFLQATIHKAGVQCMHGEP